MAQQFGAFSRYVPRSVPHNFFAPGVGVMFDLLISKIRHYLLSFSVCSLCGFC